MQFVYIVNIILFSMFIQVDFIINIIIEIIKEIRIKINIYKTNLETFYLYSFKRFKCLN